MISFHHGLVKELHDFIQPYWVPVTIPIYVSVDLHNQICGDLNPNMRLHKIEEVKFLQLIIPTEFFRS